ncbi:hypothetical protein pqer_cds_209 [Pandoravirus quercus]|uniref:Uncharacterized protein n=1 Tax=Pandoravirus quercus TaxID=2107709 RepID=A0A2U7U862_9VIRU|nr:hypothetical protein pqer_cds_209 [Pandoravirus quercus]AVK74631.1 hypothetical protein pqer_cds_209 [Pandoravirus quercus]
MSPLGRPSFQKTRADAPDFLRPHMSLDTMNGARSWTPIDAQKATAALDSLCNRLVAHAPAAGDISEWARLTAGMQIDGDGPIDCDGLIADYDAFWMALAREPRAAAAVAATRWPPSLAGVATLFDAIEIAGGIVDIGNQDPAVDLPASLERRLCRLDLLVARGPGSVDPAFPHPLPQWRSVLDMTAATRDPLASGAIDHAYAIIVSPPSAEPDEDHEYDARAQLYEVDPNGNVTLVAAGIVEWEAAPDRAGPNEEEVETQAQDGLHVARGDVWDYARARAAVGQHEARLLPEFLGRLADKRGNGNKDANEMDGQASAMPATPRPQTEADAIFDCTPGSVAGVDEVRAGLVQVGSIAGLPEAIATYDPEIEMPALMTWLDADQLRLAVDLFAGQRAAKTARAMADADVRRSLEGSAASVYRGPAFAGLLPELVADRLAFHRWVRGCAGARDRPQYEFARGFWPTPFSGDLVVRLDADPEARVDVRRTACGSQAIGDVTAAAATLLPDEKHPAQKASAPTPQEARLLCASLAPAAIRAGAWAAFGVRPLEPSAVDPRVPLTALTTQRRAWRRACAGIADPAEMAQLVATAQVLGLPLDDDDLSDPGRLCGRLALLMAL